MKLVVNGIDYNSLVANTTLLFEFEAAIKGIIANNTEVDEKYITVTTSPGSVVAQVTISPPEGSYATARSRISSGTAAVSQTIASVLAALPGIDAATNGPIDVSIVPLEDVLAGSESPTAGGNSSRASAVAGPVVALFCLLGAGFAGYWVYKKKCQVRQQQQPEQQEPAQLDEEQGTPAEQLDAALIAIAFDEETPADPAEVDLKNDSDFEMGDLCSI